MPYTIEPPSAATKYTVEPPSPVAGPAERTSQPPAETSLAAFGRGTSEAWGDRPLGEETLQSVGIYNKPGESSPIRSVNEALIRPVMTAARGVGAVTHGAQEALVAAGGPGRDIAAMPEAFAGSPGSLRMPLPSGSDVSEALFPGSTQVARRTPQTRAEELVSKTFAKTEKGGETTALDLLDQMTEARLTGQPLTISDVGGRPIRRLAGTVYRSGGEAAAQMEKFYKERGTALTPDYQDTVAGARIEKAISDHIATGSFKQTGKALAAERSEKGRPLWDEATAGGSLAPLEHQFTNAFNDASKAEQEAAKAVAQAKTAATQSAAKQAGAGNVYSTSAANRASRDAGQQVSAAETALKAARKQADEIRTRLRQAQDDGSANAPGAIWSPRLQQFLDLGDWQKGIKRGLVMERRDAVTEGRPFNPSEYAIVGTDESGAPVVGKVPTMKLLQVAKEGVAAQIDKLRDPLTGGLSKAGRSVWRNLKAFEQEGYQLNPAWKAANDAWSGDSESIRSLQLGKKIFSIPFEDLVEDFGAMSKSDKELFRLSAASKAVEDLKKTPLSADPSKRVINSPDELQRLRVLFDNDNDFKRFVDNINRERIMFETSGDVMKGSQTAERQAADVGTGLELAHGAAQLVHGHPLSAAGSFVRAGKRFMGDPKRDLEVAKILTDPNATISAGGGLPLVGGTRGADALGLRQ